MDRSLTSIITKRRFRIAQGVVVAGSLMVGLLLLNQLYALFREDFFAFYGVENASDESVVIGGVHELSITISQLITAAIAFFSIIGFVTLERSRVNKIYSIERAKKSRTAHVVVDRPCLRLIFDQIVARGSLFGGVLLLAWILQNSLDQWLNGAGWGLAYNDWRSILPLASVFGLSLIAGLLIGAISLVGARAITILELAISALTYRIARYEFVPKFAAVLYESRRPRMLTGHRVFTRPPPKQCVFA